MKDEIFDEESSKNIIYDNNDDTDDDDDDDDFDEDKLTEESYRTTFETEEDLNLEAEDVADDDY